MRAAKNRINTMELENALLKAAQLPENSTQHVVVSNVRHYEALENALKSIQRVQEASRTTDLGRFSFAGHSRVSPFSGGNNRTNI